MPSLNEIQQSFVRQYMLDERVLGVRIRRVDGEMVLDVEVALETEATLDLPSRFEGLPVRVRESVPAVLAYTLS